MVEIWFQNSNRFGFGGYGCGFHVIVRALSLEFEKDHYLIVADKFLFGIYY